MSWKILVELVMLAGPLTLCVAFFIVELTGAAQDAQGDEQ